MADLNAQAILGRIDAALTEQCPEDSGDPCQFNSVQWWSDEWKLSDCHTRKRLTEAERAGLMEKRRERRQCGSRPREVDVYRWLGEE